MDYFEEFLKTKKRGKQKTMRNGTPYRTVGRRQIQTSNRRSNIPRNSSTVWNASAGYSRNRNTVRHSAKSLGPLATVGTFLVALMSLGMMYVSQGARATSYDYELSAISSEIEDMQAKRDDLAVESARLNSIAQSESSTVAASMEESHAAGYAE